MKVRGRHINSQYLKQQKTALLKCNAYEIEEDGKILGTLLSGLHHSGDRYVDIKLREEHYLVKKTAAVFKDAYQIINRVTNEQAGSFQFGGEWFGKTSGTLTTDQTYLFKQRSAFQLFNPVTWKRCKFQLSNQSVCIEYVGEYKKSAFNGAIYPSVNDKLFEAILGLFIIDERNRIQQERQ